MFIVKKEWDHSMCVTYMLEIRNRNVEQILQLLRNAQEFDDVFCLSAEVPVNSQRIRGIDVGHLEVVF